LRITKKKKWTYKKLAEKRPVGKGRGLREVSRGGYWGVLRDAQRKESGRRGTVLGDGAGELAA